MDTKPTMLIVDDLLINRVLLHDIFKETYTILEAVNGLDAMTILKQRSDICVILLDIFMPKLDGFEVLTKVKSSSTLSKIAVIIQTQKDEPQMEIKSLELGADDFISKPYNPTIIRHRVNNAVTKNLLERKKLERALKDTSESLQSLIDSVPGGIAIYEIADKIKTLYFNDAVCALSGYTREEYSEWIKEDARVAIYPEDLELLETELENSVKEHRPIGITYRIKHKKYPFTWVHLSGVQFKEENGHPIYRAVYLDVTKEKQNELLTQKINKKLIYQAEHDNLTKLYNRETFCKQTSLLLKNNHSANFVIIRFDIERFKIINELYGTKTGDTVLKVLAEQLAEFTNKIGTCGRLEADHFVICVPLYKVKIETLLTHLTKSLKEIGLNYEIFIYAGIYLVDDITIPVDQMCDRANLALHKIKGNYLAQYAYYDNTLRDSMLLEQQIISEMKEALIKKQFVVYFQPIYSVSTNSPISAEALVRWKHPTLGFISPAVFIPIFEQNGFITKLDYYVWEQVCNYIRKAKDSNTFIVPVSINLSRMNFYIPTICEDILSLINQYDLETSDIKLEITESAYTDNPKQLMDAIQILQDYGFKILMDDFGSGYSSLNMLKDIPVDILKIDMKFINSLETSSRAANVVTSVVRMAKWLDMEVIAEGVETKSQLDFLRSIGCDSIQGYFFSKAVPYTDFIKLLEKGNHFTPKIQNLLNEFDFDILLSSSREINLLFDGMIDSMSIYELNGDCLEILRVNRGYYDIMGNSPQTLFQNTKDVFTYILEEDRQPVLEACRRSEISGQIEPIVIRKYHKNGNLIWLDLKIRFIGKKGKGSLFYFVINDITKQKEFEQEKFSRLYLTALRSIYSEIYELNYSDNTFRTLYIGMDIENRLPEYGHLDEMFEYYYFNLLHPDDREIYYKSADPSLIRKEITLSKNDCYTVDYREKDKFNSYRYVQRTLIRIDAGDNKDVFLSCIMDISQRKKEEELLEQIRINQAHRELQDTQNKLRKRTEELQSILNRLPVGIGIYNIEETITIQYINEQAYKMFGLTPKILANLKRDGIEFFSDYNQESVNRILSSMKSNLYTDNVTIEKKADGTKFYMRSFTSIYRESQEHSLTCYAVLADVTKQVKTEHELNWQSELCRMLMEQSDIIIFDYDTEKDKLNYSVKPNNGKRIQHSISDFLEKSIVSTMIHEKYQHLYYKIIAEATKNPVSGEIEYLANFFQNGYRWYRSYYSSLADNNGVIYRIIGNAEDIHKEKLKTEELFIEKKYRSAMTANSLFAFTFDLEGYHTQLIHQAENYKDEYYPFSNLILKSNEISYVHPEDKKAVLSTFSLTNIVQSYKRNENEIKLQYRLLNRKHEWIWVETVIHITKNHITKKLQGFGYVKIINEQKQLQLKAELDSLCNIYNRATLEEKAMKLEKSGKKYAFFLYDIDNFKKVNDTYGHTEGDHLLRQISEIFRTSFSKEDIIGRIGGDEFVILFHDIEEDSIQKIASYVLNEIMKLTKKSQKNLLITVSTGIALPSNTCSTYDSLYRTADKALYEAKEKGKNCFVILYENENL